MRPDGVTGASVLIGRTLYNAVEAHRLLYHSTLGLRVIKKKKKQCSEADHFRP